MERRDAKKAVLEVLRAIPARDGDMGEMRDTLPMLSAFLREHAAPDFVCAMVPLPPTPEVTYPGVDGLERAWEDWGGAFESLRAEAEEIIESDAHVVMLVKQIAVTRHGGVEISQPSAIVWALAGERVARVEFHLDQAAALRAGGLGQPPA